MSEVEEGTIHEEEEGLRVPRVLRSAEVLLADGMRLKGRLFLPASSDAHAGVMRVDEWMNEPTAFYPFLPDGEGRPVVLGKEQTVMLSVQAADDRDESLDVPAPRSRVLVECRQGKVEGEVVLDLPDQQTRVLDLLNRDQLFLTVEDGDVHHLVRLTRITRVVEAAEPDA